MYHYILLATLSGYEQPSLYRPLFHFIMDLFVACTYFGYIPLLEVG
jgi:hypothetical protein